jgi:hypothetical protein
MGNRNGILLADQSHPIYHSSFGQHSGIQNIYSMAVIPICSVRISGKKHNNSYYNPIEIKNPSV